MELIGGLSSLRYLGSGTRSFFFRFFFFYLILLFLAAGGVFLLSYWYLALTLHFSIESGYTYSVIHRASFFLSSSAYVGHCFFFFFSLGRVFFLF
jgi:hypothetical protein